jgi:hypothetical protein
VKSGNDTLAAWPDGHLIYTAPESEIPTTTEDATQKTRAETGSVGEHGRQ